MIESLKFFLKSNNQVLRIASFTYTFVFNFRAFFCKSIIEISGTFLRRNCFVIEGKNNEIIIGKFSRIRNCKFTIIGNNCKIKIGGDSTIISDTHFWCQDNYSSIEIGNNFTMEGGHVASTEGEKIIIGNDCMFSNNIEIRNGDSHSIIDTINKKRINHAKSVSIGDHVWLTANVKILKGSFIADNSVVGNSSVVSGKLDNKNSLYSGIPCKLIKENIDWDRNKI